MSVRVIFKQITSEGEHYMFEVIHHQESMVPKVGECVHYGCTVLEVRDVVHRYQMSDRGVYSHSHIEVIVA